MRALLLLCLLAGGDDPSPWTQAKPGEFPAAGTAREISGELIGMDPVARTGTLRPDRNDSQRTDDYDVAHPFSQLPYAKTMFHGSYAELRDVPIGTHLHGLFFVQDAPAKNQKPVFNRVLQLEDDFSRMTRLKRTWRVDTVEADKGRLVVTGIGADGQADAKPTTFQIGSATRVWKGRGLAKLADLAAGQQGLANLPVGTRKGPGRCTAPWIAAAG